MDTWVSDMLTDNRLDTALAKANAIGTEGESYSRLPKLFDIIEH